MYLLANSTVQHSIGKNEQWLFIDQFMILAFRYCTNSHILFQLVGSFRHRILFGWPKLQACRIWLKIFLKHYFWDSMYYNIQPPQFAIYWKWFVKENCVKVLTVWWKSKSLTENGSKSIVKWCQKINVGLNNVLKLRFTYSTRIGPVTEK